MPKASEASQTSDEQPRSTSDGPPDLVFQAAHWMATELEGKGVLFQSDVADRIEKKVSKTLVRENDNGTRSINGRVLREFKKLTKDVAIWENAQKCWRKRTPTDELGKRRAD